MNDMVRKPTCKHYPEWIMTVLLEPASKEMVSWNQKLPICNTQQELFDGWLMGKNRLIFQLDLNLFLVLQDVVELHGMSVLNGSACINNKV
jgi:hypothetical protein